MAAKKTRSGYDYFVAALKKNPKATYADVAAAAKKKGLTAYPVMWGRAQAALGIVKSKKRKKKAAGRPKATPTGRTGRRPANALPASTSSLDHIIQAVRSSQAETERLRKALAQVQSIVAEALG